jgi:hypothetical protein
MQTLTPLLVPATLCVLAAPAWGQSAGSGEPGPRPLLEPAHEIALARSAAPPQVSGAAEVWVLGEQGYSLAAPGTSGAACLVARDWVTSLEPVCYDPEAAATMMRIAMKRVELLHRGRPVAEVDAEVARAIGAGELRLPRRVAVAYMQSAAQRLVGDDGTPVGAWRPHLMLYLPYLTAAELGFSDAAAPGSLMLVDGGAPTSMMMIVVPDALEPRTLPPPE